eukprot:CAMPEP_0198506646 /NCGR_PEP_ID=MMETSP1462-20131121/11824_1 /TAXON_ID=1333877 /ORGANISM="Brandtodinium nutriculum, Strain RCC3387" /LENGTH=56 /DNA_ID=CAMNT_0044235871 /DNA_START=60 /DNA_END=230 /DNA_ORIENTATION=-
MPLTGTVADPGARAPGRKLLGPRRGQQKQGSPLTPLSNPAPLPHQRAGLRRRASPN